MVLKRTREKIFEEYIKGNKEKLYKISYVYLKNKDDAMDVIHESIVKAYRKLDNIKDLNSIDKWFIRLLINTSIDYIRKNSKMILMEDKDMEALINNSKEQGDGFNLLIENLNEELRLIIILKYFNGYKINEISEILNIKESQVKNKIHKALNLLRKEIEEE
ncbi:sigma-70 family RNA polymerase sigma factor [Clostridium sp. AL.422]|uniref:sigma-70 family RNA polymerase sigma factor n=1 Tax=Clostridium TaxID=1485 RepID=UPI00293DC0E3|nr:MULTISPECIES: sigma-70 family RNA polymerase sigma factor [unclassified Clostridium]MDV4152520.1 sigma-70 family RNA polymerase sigma factor [Clostridium sp. AL.422]